MKKPFSCVRQAKSPLLPLFKKRKPIRVLPFVKGRQRGFQMTAGASFNGRADDPQSSPFLLGMLVDWTGGFLAGWYFVVALGLGILFVSFLMGKE